MDIYYFDLEETDEGFYCKELRRNFQKEIKNRAVTSCGKYYLQAKVNKRDANGIPVDFEIPAVG